MRRIGCRSQSELADRLGITQGAVSAWGSGIRSPRYEDCKRLLEMGMTIGELFGESTEAAVSSSAVNPQAVEGSDRLDDFLAGLKDLVERVNRK